MKKVIRIILGLAAAFGGVWFGYLAITSSAEAWVIVSVVGISLAFIAVGAVAIFQPKYIKEALIITTLFQ